MKQPKRSPNDGYRDGQTKAKPKPKPSKSS